MTNAAAWIFNISFPSWNQMEVAMENRLTRDLPCVQTDVETRNGRVAGLDLLAYFTKQIITTKNLIRGQIKVGRCMAPRDD
jgi:hypothetical protein